jgi:hypothetical protein
MRSVSQHDSSDVASATAAVIGVTASIALSLLLLLLLLLLCCC